MDYLFRPGLEISASFSEPAGEEGDVDTVVAEAVRYSTENNTIYLFPVFKELAKQHGVKFTLRYNKVFNLRRIIFTILIALSNYIVKTRGIEHYKEIMKVKYDGF